MMERNRGTDHTLLRRLQVQVGDRLEKAITDRARSGEPALSTEDEEAFKALVRAAVALNTSKGLK